MAVGPKDGQIAIVYLLELDAELLDVHDILDTPFVLEQDLEPVVLLDAVDRDCKERDAARFSFCHHGEVFAGHVQEE